MKPQLITTNYCDKYELTARSSNLQQGSGERCRAIQVLRYLDQHNRRLTQESGWQKIMLDTAANYVGQKVVMAMGIQNQNKICYYLQSICRSAVGIGGYLGEAALFEAHDRDSNVDPLSNCPRAGWYITVLACLSLVIWCVSISSRLILVQSCCLGLWIINLLVMVLISSCCWKYLSMNLIRTPICTWSCIMTPLIVILVRFSRMRLWTIMILVWRCLITCHIGLLMVMILVWCCLMLCEIGLWTIVVSCSRHFICMYCGLMYCTIPLLISLNRSASSKMPTIIETLITSAPTESSVLLMTPLWSISVRVSHDSPIKFCTNTRGTQQRQ
jgi:hypothetical protein